MMIPTPKRPAHFELTVSAACVRSTDERFTMDDLSLGDHYRPLDACFRRADGGIVRRAYKKGERRNTARTLPRIACQVFERALRTLPPAERARFPVCRYTPESETIRGVFASTLDFRARCDASAHLDYRCGDGSLLVLYCQNLFSTILFLQECLRRFGAPGERFVLIYREREADGGGSTRTARAAHPRRTNPAAGLAPAAGRVFSPKELSVKLRRRIRIV